MIFDTNAVSTLLAGDSNIGKVLSKVSTYHLPLVVIGEYQFGLLALRKRNRYASLFHKLESASTLLYPDRQTADWYAQIRHDLKQRGTPIPEGDLWIAALAQQHGLEVLSQDSHFDHLTRLRRVGW